MNVYSVEQVNWTWGISLIVLTLMVHALGVVMMALPGLRLRHWLGGLHLRPAQKVPIVVGVIAAVGMLLAVLHGIEAAIWALAYQWLGGLSTFNDALFYSVDSMTTRGASGLPLEQHWRMLGAVEAMDGMLLFGISTAYLFAVMQVYWPMLTTNANRTSSDI